MSRSAWRDSVLITAAALGLFILARWLPTGTNLSHMDFRVGGNSIEFCDPANPQFIPVVAVKSPVTLSIRTGSVPVAGSDVQGVLTLKTYSGKAIGPADLLVVQTKKIHLMLVDPSLEDYQHVHPAPGRIEGEWTFSFHPKYGGIYRAFADFTPVATQRGLYASTDLPVEGTPSSVVAGTQPLSWRARHGDFDFTVAADAIPVKARQPVTLDFRIVRTEGGTVPLGLLMGAYAHLVAFDAGRSGFAHIHPAPDSAPPDAAEPHLRFKVAIPNAGRYVLWTQVDLAGTDVAVPFWFEVAAP